MFFFVFLLTLAGGQQDDDTPVFAAADDVLLMLTGHNLRFLPFFLLLLTAAALAFTALLQARSSGKKFCIHFVCTIVSHQALAHHLFFFLLFITLQRTRAAPIKEESQQSVSRLMIAGK